MWLVYIYTNKHDHFEWYEHHETFVIHIWMRSNRTFGKAKTTWIFNSFLWKTASLFLHSPLQNLWKIICSIQNFAKYILWVPNILDLSSGSVFYEASTETKLQRSSIVLKLICKRKKKKRVNSKNISIPIDVSMSIALTTMRSNLT